VRIARGNPSSLKACSKTVKAYISFGGEGLTANQIAAREVCDRERIAVALIGEHELALVIGAPQIIWRARLGERGSLRLVAASSAACDQSMPVQDRVHRADRRTLHIPVQPAQAFANLRSAPIGALLLQLNDQLLDLKRQLPRMSVGSTGAIRQTLNATVLDSSSLTVAPGLSQWH
jgi:hypothetical protein